MSLALPASLYLLRSPCLPFTTSSTGYLPKLAFAGVHARRKAGLKRNSKWREGRSLAVLRSRERPRDGDEERTGKRASASSVRGPSDWKRVFRKHREALNI